MVHRVDGPLGFLGESWYSFSGACVEVVVHEVLVGVGVVVQVVLTPVVVVGATFLSLALPALASETAFLSSMTGAAMCFAFSVVGMASNEVSIPPLFPYMGIARYEDRARTVGQTKVRQNSTVLRET